MNSREMRPDALARQPEWQERLEKLVLGNGLSLQFQPIVDLRRGIVTGYEALARFQGPPLAGPDLWFAVALELGLSLSLEARVVKQAIEASRTLPPNCFLSLNASPEMLTSPMFEAMMTDAGSFAGLVIEVTEHAEVADYEALTAVAQSIRARGGSIAVDDAGAGYASMNHILTLRPQFVKIDKAFVTDCFQDPAKLALVEMIGTFAGSLDAWVIAEGIESQDELDALINLRVPLGQGYLLGRPQPAWGTMMQDVALRIRNKAAESESSEAIGALIESARTVALGEQALPREHEIVVVVDASGRPLGMLFPRGAGRVVSKHSGLTLVKRTTSVDDAARRAMTREPSQRFDPIICIDDEGAYTGIVRIESLVLQMSRRAA